MVINLISPRGQHSILTQSHQFSVSAVPLKCHSIILSGQKFLGNPVSDTVSRSLIMYLLIYLLYRKMRHLVKYNVTSGSVLMVQILCKSSDNSDSWGPEDRKESLYLEDVLSTIKTNWVPSRAYRAYRVNIINIINVQPSSWLVSKRNGILSGLNICLYCYQFKHQFGPIPKASMLMCTLLESWISPSLTPQLLSSY